MANQVQTSIIKILAEQALLDVSDITGEQSLGDLGMDSLALVEAIFAIEEAFNIDVPFNANQPDSGEFDISSVSSIVAAVEKLLSEQAK